MWEDLKNNPESQTNLKVSMPPGYTGTFKIDDQVQPALRLLKDGTLISATELTLKIDDAEKEQVTFSGKLDPSTEDVLFIVPFTGVLDWGAFAS